MDIMEFLFKKDLSIEKNRSSFVFIQGNSTCKYKKETEEKEKLLIFKSISSWYLYINTLTSIKTTGNMPFEINVLSIIYRRTLTINLKCM